MSNFQNNSSLVALDLNPAYHEFYVKILETITNRGLILDDSLKYTIKELTDFIIGALVANLIKTVQYQQSHDPNYNNNMHSLAESLTDFIPDIDTAITLIKQLETFLLNILIAEVPSIDDLRIKEYNVSLSNSLIIERLN